MARALVDEIVERHSADIRADEAGVCKRQDVVEGGGEKGLFEEGAELWVVEGVEHGGDSAGEVPFDVLKVAAVAIPFDAEGAVARGEA